MTNKYYVKKDMTISTVHTYYHVMSPEDKKLKTYPRALKHMAALEVHNLNCDLEGKPRWMASDDG